MFAVRKGGHNKHGGSMLCTSIKFNVYLDQTFKFCFNCQDFILSSVKKEMLKQLHPILLFTSMCDIFQSSFNFVNLKNCKVLFLISAELLSVAKIICC